jgi:hypothetical protein
MHCRSIRIHFRGRPQVVSDAGVDQSADPRVLELPDLPANVRCAAAGHQDWGLGSARTFTLREALLRIGNGAQYSQQRRIASLRITLWSRRWLEQTLNVGEDLLA